MESSLTNKISRSEKVTFLLATLNVRWFQLAQNLYVDFQCKAVA